MRLKKMSKRVWAVTMSVCMTATSMATQAPVVALAAPGEIETARATDWASFTNDEVVGKYQFGTDVTSGTVSGSNGYGFADVNYDTAAVGWSGNVYYPRVPAVTEGRASYVTDGNGYLKIDSKVWTETESTGYGVYTYETTSTFDVELPAADYEVEVTFVNPTDSAYIAYVEAEDITQVSDITVAAGETKTVSYESSLIDDTLNLKFLAANSATTMPSDTQSVYVSDVTITRKATEEAGSKPTIYIASDSTVQTYEKNYYPQTGWGQVLSSFFGDLVEEREAVNSTYSQSQVYETTNAIIENRAIGGRSSKSFVEEGKLEDLLEDVKPGDYVLVQWGHNDATNSRPNRYVSSSDFKEWMMYYVNGAIERGATPILVTPVARYSYTTDSNSELISFASNFEAYRQVMLSIAEEYNIPLVDLTERSIEVCNNFGIEGSKSLFLWLNAGDYPDGAYADGASDSTHLQFYGAYKFAQCVAQGIQEYTADAQLDGLKELVSVILPEKEPGQVYGLASTTVGASSVSMVWDSEADSELYYIYRAELQEGQTEAEVDFTNADKYSVSSINKYTDSSCEGGKTYVYAIRGFNEKGLGEISEMITVTTKDAGYRFDFNYNSSPTMTGWTGINQSYMYNAAAGYGWLTSPGNGRYRANNGNADASDMADDFCLGAGGFAVDLPNGDYEITVYACDLLPGTSTIKPSYTAEGLAIGGISTKQALGSVTGTARVLDGQLNLSIGGTNQYINGMTITELLLAPTGLTGTELSISGSQASFLLGFNGINEAVAYRVYQKAESDKSFSLAKSFTVEELAEDELSCRAMAAIAGENYEYYVTAVTADGTESAPSNTVLMSMVDGSVETPAAPENFICVNAATANMQLSWSRIDSAFKYIVYRSDKAEGDKGFVGFEKVGESTTNSYTDTDAGVTANVHYYYKVQAVNAGGAGEISAAVETPITETLEKKNLENYTDRAVTAINLAGKDGAETNLSATDADGKEYSSGVYLSWRSFEADENVTFNVYRNGTLIAEAISVTNLVDEAGTAADTYRVEGSNDAAFDIKVLDTPVWENQYLELELYIPADEVMPDGTIAKYSANDMSVGDMDGDGDLELVVKWYPSNAKDNSGSGYTGKTFIDAYDVNYGTGAARLLWRVDMGINIRSGAHYTQFQVWDFDGDGKAELAVKTADGTTIYKSVDGTDKTLVEMGYVGASNAEALPVETISTANDYRNSSGYVLSGPEYFTMFNGDDATILDTVDYTPARGSVSAWGDAYGNRVDRFLSATAYLDGVNPYAVFARGYYTRTCLTAYYAADTDGDGIGDAIKEYWAFDTDVAGTQYEGQGNHGLSVNDVDHDGKDEIIYGALTVDDDGTVKYSTDLGHGDAMHVSDWLSWNDGLEIMDVHEHDDVAYHVEIHDAETGEILAGYNTGKDTGRGVAADIDPTSVDAEWWSIASPTYESNDEPSWDSKNGEVYAGESTLENLVKLSDSTPASNFTIFWDGDLLSEILDHRFESTAYVPVAVTIAKWDYENEKEISIFDSEEVWSSNGTKGNPGLAADILGDWREEIIVRCSDSVGANKVRIYSTTIQTDYVVPCLLENLAYREGIAWQNVGYNQPANLDYLLSAGVETAQVTVGEVGINYAEVAFSEASDGTYGHDITAYEVYRAAGSGEYKLIDTVTLEQLHKYNPDSSVAGDEAAEEVVFEEDFEDMDNSFSLIAAGNTANEYLEADTSTVNANTSTAVYGVGARAGGDTGAKTEVLGITEDVTASFDLKMDACQQGKSSNFSLISGDNTLNWLDNSTQQILTISAEANGNGYWGSITVNGENITATANVSNGKTNGESSNKGGLTRDTTGWMHVEAALDFAAQMVDVTITRISDGSTIYAGNLPFINTVDTFDRFFMAGGKTYGAVFTDNIKVTKKTEVKNDDSAAVSDLYSYVDRTVEPNSEYSYKIAAVVDGKTSFMSRAVKAKTLVSIGTVGEFTLAPVVQDVVLAGGQTLADLLPAELEVVDEAGKTTSVAVTWDVSAVDVTKAGDYAVYGTILGYAETIEKILTVEANAVTGFSYGEAGSIISVAQGSAEVGLPAEAVITCKNGATETLPVTWNAEDVAAIDLNTIADVKLVHGTVTVASSGIGAYTVEIGVQVKADFITEVAAIAGVEAVIGSSVEELEAVLPETAAVSYKSGKTENASVSWNTADITAADLEKAGSFVVTGTVENYDNTVSVMVTVSYETIYRFDFGIKTSEEAEGWTGITVNAKGGSKTNDSLGITYTAEKGYGFTDGNAKIEGRSEGYVVDGATLPEAAYKDFAIPDGNTFAVDLPAGVYQVDIIGGSAYKSTVKATVEGQSMSVTNAANTYAVKTFEALEVTDGQLTIAFTSGSTSRTDGIVIRLVELVKEEAPAYIIYTDGVEGAEGGQVSTEGTTVTAEANDGYKFGGWYKVAGDYERFVTESAATELAEGTTLIAKFLSETSYTVRFESNGNLIDTKIVAEGETVEPSAEIPVVPGYVFDGWDFDFADPITENTVIAANFVKEAVNCSLTVVNGTADQDEAEIGTIVRITAEEPEDGMEFAYWLINDQRLDAASTYVFYLMEDTTAEAVYAETAPEAEVSIMSKTPVVNQAAAKISFTVERFVPEAYTVVAHGILMISDPEIGEDDDAFTLEADGVLNGKASGKTRVGTYTLAKGKVGAGATWYGRGYVTYQDAEGETFTVYGDTVSATMTE